MVDLDDLNSIKKLDSRDALSSIGQLADQCKQAWAEVSLIDLSDTYRNVKAIVVAGMGGSAYGGRILKSIYDRATTLSVPVELTNSYWLPGYVDGNTLVFLSSYSGTTEEILACAHEAQVKNAKIIGITSGGPLADFLTSNNYPAYIFDPRYNPSQQPRMGQGYMQIGLLGILAKLGFISISDQEIKDTITTLQTNDARISVSTQRKQNPAKSLAQLFFNKIPVVIVADFLEGAAHAIRNPFHETAKQFGLYFVIPELNHHLMEGLQFPKTNREILLFVFVESQLYSQENKKRLTLTRSVVSKNHIPIHTITLWGKTKLSQTMELIHLGGYITFYLAMLNNVDPNQIPWVDYFKKALKS